MISLWPSLDYNAAVAINDDGACTEVFTGCFHTSKGNSLNSNKQTANQYKYWHPYFITYCLDVI